MLSLKLEFTITYQLDLVTPTISPQRAKLRKQIRHISNLRRYARGRPQIGHRLYFRVVNFLVFNVLILNDFLAKILFSH